MTVRELGQKCKAEQGGCVTCDHKEECDKMRDMLVGAPTPEEMLTFLERELD